MNELHKSLSPYLLQHKNNPIHWKLWNTETLKKAEENDQLIVISIGYSSCHWCHVMAHECFEDLNVAQFMNEHFVNIKIDREENPDIDAIYMTALQILTQQGGWPLNIVALPNGYPIWGSTYLPKEKWLHQLTELQKLYVNDKERVVEYADQLHQHLHLSNNMDLILTEKTDISLEQLFKKWQSTFDYEYGGIDRAPKFIMPTHWNFLLQYSSSNPEIDSYIENSLTKIAVSGINDLVEGGFYRYSVDHYWHIPHFEKMLYDQGQLISLYSKASQKYNNSFFKEVAQYVSQFVIKNWKSNQGGFFGSYDADSFDNNNKTVEGFYYTITEQEFNEMKLEHEQIIRKAFAINRDFIWENKYYHLQKVYSTKQLAQLFNVTETLVENSIKAFLSKCFELRKTKAKPNLDTKIITSWNALLLNGMIDLYKISQDEKLEREIDELYQYLTTNAISENRIIHSNSLDHTQNELLEDYATIIQALINYYQVHFNDQTLLEAKALIDQAFDLFFDEEQGFFTSYIKTDIHIITQIEIEDNVIPSFNSTMADNLYMASILFSNDYYKKVADNMMHKVLEHVESLAAYSEWNAIKLKYNNQFKYLVAKGYNVDTLRNIQLQLNDSNLFVIPVNSTLSLAKNYSSMDHEEIQICNMKQCFIKTKKLSDLFEKKY